MNKVVLMGRLTKDPETRYSQSAEPVAVSRFTLAVNRRFKRDNEPDADFIGCVVFGKQAEFAEKYCKKGMMMTVSGRIQVRTWDDQNGTKHWTTEVVCDELEFAESKSSFESRQQPSYQQPFPEAGGFSGGSGKSYGKPAAQPSYEPDGFSAIAESIDDEDLPF